MLSMWTKPQCLCLTINFGLSKSKAIVDKKYGSDGSKLCKGLIKTFWERRKCWLPMFSRAFIQKLIKIWDFVAEHLTFY